MRRGKYGGKCVLKVSMADLSAVGGRRAIFGHVDFLGCGATSLKEEVSALHPTVQDSRINSHAGLSIGKIQTHRRSSRRYQLRSPFGCMAGSSEDPTESEKTVRWVFSSGREAICFRVVWKFLYERLGREREFGEVHW